MRSHISSHSIESPQTNSIFSVSFFVETINLRCHLRCRRHSPAQFINLYPRWKITRNPEDCKKLKRTVPAGGDATPQNKNKNTTLQSTPTVNQSAIMYPRRERRCLLECNTSPFFLRDRLKEQPQRGEGQRRRGRGKTWITAFLGDSDELGGFCLIEQEKLTS